MYGGGTFFGTFSVMSFTPEDVDTGYSAYSDWFFQHVAAARSTLHDRRVVVHGAAAGATRTGVAGRGTGRNDNG